MVRKLQPVADLLKEKISQIAEKSDRQVQSYVNHEFQDYGYRLALRLSDISHKALYIRYAKVVPRALLEDAAAFADTYTSAKSQGKIFSWKLKELLTEYRLKHPEFRMISPKRSAKVKRSSKANKENLPLL